MTTDPKFQPLVDDLKNWLELRKQKETAKAAGFNSVMDAFRPTANYLEQLGKELKNNVDQTISIGLIGRWKEGPDQKFTVRYEVNFKGQVSKLSRGCPRLPFWQGPMLSQQPSYCGCPFGGRNSASGGRAVMRRTSFQ